MSLMITFKMESSHALFHHRLIPHTFSDYSIHTPHKITFLHPGGIVSYAILRAPSPNVSRGLHGDKALPVILNLHGAGLEADSQQVRHMLDSVPDLRGWLLFPTGVTTWSGDDWRRSLFLQNDHVLILELDHWGFADAEAAIGAITDWMIVNDWTGPSVDIDKWLVSGHSNGG